MKKTTLISLLLLFGLTVYSQENYSFEAGKVTQYEMSMTEDKNYPDAEAVVIYEFGDNYMQVEESWGGFVLHKKRRTKIKVLKESGLKYADFEMPIYIAGNTPEQLSVENAIVYNLENNALIRTELDKKKIYQEKVNDRWLLKKFTMPNVKEGSVIEVEYIISTPYFFNMGEWEFQKKIPVVYSKLRYKAIPYYEYTYIMKGANKFDEFENNILNTEIRSGNLLYREVEYIFGMKNLPPFKDEEFITSPKDYMVSLSFQLSKINYPNGSSKQIMSTWPALCDAFIKHSDFGKYVNSSEKQGKKLLAELSLSGLSPEEQLRTITQHVKSVYNWNGMYGKYAREKLSDFMKNKKGNVANLNLYLIGLLRASGLDAVPVVISTRSNGSISRLHPFEDFFNYVIAQVTIDGKQHFIDATEPLLYYNQLPIRCINVQGLVVKPKTEEWTVITQNEAAMIEKNFHICKMPGQDVLNVQTNYICSGQGAYNFRSTYMGKEDNLSQYLKKTNGIDIKDNIVVKNATELELPFSFSFNFDTDVEATSDKLFITPFCKLSIMNNPLKQASRKLAVDFIFARGEKYKSTIEIPEGYKVESVPKSGHFDNKILSFNYTAGVIENNKIEVETQYVLKRPVFTAQEYIPLKNFFTLIIEKTSEMIVLVKE